MVEHLKYHPMQTAWRLAWKIAAVSVASSIATIYFIYRHLCLPPGHYDLSTLQQRNIFFGIMLLSCFLTTLLIVLAKRGYWLFILVLFSVIAPILAYIITPHYVSWQPLVCQNRLRGLYTAIQVYSKEFGGKLPISKEWCDVLIEKCDISEKSFICPVSDAIEGESSYAINSHISGMKWSELSPETVLLYETCAGVDPNGRAEPVENRNYARQLKMYEWQNVPIQAGQKKVYKDRFNQQGNPENLKVFSHRGYTSVLFADGNVDFIKEQEVGNLKWIPDKIKVNQNGQPSQP